MEALIATPLGTIKRRLHVARNRLALALMESHPEYAEDAA